ncbi:MULTISPECIES: histidine kinase [Streptomyces]|uniref:histidine kinase n=1 Tax=Streptomyces TaxID=1883 RepID=UPI00384B91EC
MERRRIEGDLHDGARQRLVALTMTLGLPLSTPAEAPRRSVGQVPRRGGRGPRGAVRTFPRLRPKVLAGRGLGPRTRAADSGRRVRRRRRRRPQPFLMRFVSSVTWL